MKQLLMEKRKSVQAEIRSLKKFQTAARKEKDTAEARRLGEKIETLERSLPRYKVTVQPIQFSNQVMVDGALVKAYYNKLPANLKRNVTAELTSEGLTLRHTHGFIELQNLFTFYQEFIVPRGEVFLNELGITIS